MNKKKKYIIIALCIIFSFSLPADIVKREQTFLQILNDFEILKNLPEKGERFAISAKLKTVENGITGTFKIPDRTTGNARKCQQRATKPMDRHHPWFSR